MTTTTDLNITDRNLWATLLWATSDPDREGYCLDEHYTLHDVDPASAAKLNAEYWAWHEKLDDVLISHGLEHLSPSEIAGTDRLEHVYVLVREGHGVAFTDDWHHGSREYKAAKVMGNLAAAQGPIDAYPGDDGLLHCL